MQGAAVDSEVKEVARLLASAGARVLQVGGSVRDSLLGLKAEDFDLECFGISPDDLAAVLGRRYRLDLVGASFGVIKLHGLGIDVALPRRETKLGLGHRAFSASYDPSIGIAEAASRRDFTINAIYRDPLTGEIIDPWNGVEDLERRRLRHVSAHFTEDPLRVLRGMQFVARFSLEACGETVGLCRTMTMENLPAERLMGEWTKLLVKGKKISSGLDFLRSAGWVGYFPELEKLIGCNQEPKWHPEGDVWNHTLQCLDAFASSRDGFGADEDLIVGLAVLCHDFGKPESTFYDPVKKAVRSPGHDERGVSPAKSFLARLTNEERIFRDVIPLVRYHMRPYAMWKGNASDAAVRRLAAKVGRIDRLIRVAFADDRGRFPFPSDPTPLLWLESAARRLEVAAAAPAAIMRGRDLIALGLKPSAEFGDILRRLYEAQLDGRFSDLEGAIGYCRKHVL